MRSASIPLLFAASLLVAAPASAQSLPAAPDAPLPGLSENADQSLWCATMASQLAQSALASGDHQSFEILAPMAMALSRQVSTLFVVLHIGEPDVRDFLDLYAAEIEAVIAGTAPERYAPEQCQSIVAPDLVV